MNDLYLYGDYLEKELKVSNDENVKLLEKFKVMKIQVHSLNQKNNKLKQNIEILSKKEKEEKMKNKEEENNTEIIKLNNKTKKLEETITDLENNKKK